VTSVEEALDSESLFKEVLRILLSGTSSFGFLSQRLNGEVCFQMVWLRISGDGVEAFFWLGLCF
jgi:hypothetical protein